MLKKGNFEMKLERMVIVIVLIMMMGIASAGDRVVQFDKEKDIFSERETAPEETAVEKESTLNEYGNMALKPIETFRDTTNDILNPRMELLYEAKTDGADFTAEGPKFKLSF
ncbi:hypothetical protein ACFL3D_00020 [Candidatus Omnitrophota bacterium]